MEETRTKRRRRSTVQTQGEAETVAENKASVNEQPDRDFTLQEPSPERLEPDPHGLDVEAVKITNDISYYQRLADDAEDRVREAERHKKEVRAGVFLEMQSHGTKYNLPKDQATAAQANAVIDAVECVSEAEKELNWRLRVRDHYKGVLWDLQRKERAIERLHSMWRDQYFSGPSNLPHDLHKELSEHKMGRMEELTSKSRRRFE